MTSSEQTPPASATGSALSAEALAGLVRSVWWLVLLRGVVAIAFGVVALVAPLVAGFAVVFVFAAFALVEGVIEIVHAVLIRRQHARGGWVLAMGIIGVIAGVVAFIFPAAALLVYGSFGLALIAFYSVMMGIAGFPAAAAATDGGRKVLGYVVAVASVLLGVVLAIILIVNPGILILNLIWIVGVWAIIIGALLVIAAISARIRARSAASGTAAAPARG